jgi:hypothetical protein
MPLPDSFHQKNIQAFSRKKREERLEFLVLERVKLY